jgi:hypothetical protein
MLSAITAAGLLPFYSVHAAALGPQNTSTGQVVISVVDQSGAAIPGASIGIIQLPVANPPIPNKHLGFAVIAQADFQNLFMP